MAQQKKKEEELKMKEAEKKFEIELTLLRSGQIRKFKSRVESMKKSLSVESLDLLLIAANNVWNVNALSYLLSIRQNPQFAQIPTKILDDIFLKSLEKAQHRLSSSLLDIPGLSPNAAISALRFVHRLPPWAFLLTRKLLKHVEKIDPNSPLEGSVVLQTFDSFFDQKGSRISQDMLYKLLRLPVIFRKYLWTAWRVAIKKKDYENIVHVQTLILQRYSQDSRIPCDGLLEGFRLTLSPELRDLEDDTKQKLQKFPFYQQLKSTRCEAAVYESGLYSYTITRL